MTSPIDVEEAADGPRLNMSGEDAEILVRHRGEPLKALQHVVDMAFGRELADDQRVFVDVLSYRKGKDLELRQMAKYLAEQGQGDWRRSATRAAESLRAPPGAHGRRRSAWCVHGEHRRRVHEDRDDFREEVELQASGRLRAPGQRLDDRRAESPRADSPESRADSPTPSQMFSTTDTIVAIATPPGRGAIGVVRLSGPESQRDRCRLARSRERHSSRGGRHTRASPPARIRRPGHRHAVRAARFVHRRGRRGDQRAWERGGAQCDPRARGANAAHGSPHQASSPFART